MKRSISVISTKNTQEEIFQDLYSQISEVGKSPILIVFFADYDCFWYVATNLKKSFPAAITIGCSTSLNYINNEYNPTGASAMAIFSGIECAEGVLFEIGRHPSNYIMHLRNAVNSLTTYENTCCLEFNNSFTNGEELVLDTFAEVLEGKNITVFGGSAGASIDKNDKSMVSLNGEVYQNSCVFCLIHNLEGRIFYYKENIYKPTKYNFLTTDVDCDERIIYELNNRPAADVIAESVGLSLEKLQEEIAFHPLGRIFNNDILITAINKIYNDGSISCFSKIHNRAKVAILEVDDIENVWDNTVDDTKKMIENPSFTFVVNCLSRTMLFEKKNLLKKYNKLLSKNFNSFIGLSGYSEQLGFNHLNNTMVIAMFE